jgi:hypothetical protein
METANTLDAAMNGERPLAVKVVTE